MEDDNDGKGTRGEIDERMNEVTENNDIRDTTPLKGCLIISPCQSMLQGKKKTKNKKK